MTMDESLAWGDQLRASQGLNSSAKGAFQIVNTTQRAAMAALGIKGDEMFSRENQRRMASWIARTQGLSAWEGFKSHPDQLTVAAAALQQGRDRDIAEAPKAAPSIIGSANAAPSQEPVIHHRDGSITQGDKVFRPGEPHPAEPIHHVFARARKALLQGRGMHPISGKVGDIPGFANTQTGVGPHEDEFHEWMRKGQKIPYDPRNSSIRPRSSNTKNPHDLIQEILDQYGIRKAEFKTSPLGHNSSWHRPSSNQVAMNQKTEIHVHGVDDPQEAARRVGRHQTRVNSDLLKNTMGAIG
jgi:hypothetical protein